MSPSRSSPSAPVAPGAAPIPRTGTPPIGRVRSTTAGGEDRTHLVPVLGLRATLRVRGTPEDRVAAIAARQRGRVARRQLLLAGLSGREVTRLLRRHTLLPCHHGVYAVGHLGPVPLGKETAALLACGMRVMLAAESVAFLCGMRGIAAPTEVHVLVPDAVVIRRPGIRAHRSRDWARIRPVLRDGLPMTSPALTLLQLVPQLRLAEAERLVRGAIDDRIVRAGDCTRIIGELPQLPGAPRLRAILAAPDASLTESELERRLILVLRDADLPQPQRQVRVAGYRLDFYYPHARVALETDGYGTHGTRQRFEGDRERDARLAALGIVVLRFTWRQLRDEPVAVAARIAAVLGQRTPPMPPER